jgi:hypothetical protein
MRFASSPPDIPPQSSFSLRGRPAIVPDEGPAQDGRKWAECARQSVSPCARDSIHSEQLPLHFCLRLTGLVRTRRFKAMQDDPQPQSWWQTFPGVLTAIAAVVTAVTGLIVALRDNEQSKPAPVAPGATAVAPASTTVAPASSPEREESAAPAPDLSGLWRDSSGGAYRIVQNGNAFGFEASGASCLGSLAQSNGNGTITGNSVQSNYQSTVPSRGSCSGSLSSDRATLNATCTDSICGTYTVFLVRQH